MYLNAMYFAFLTVTSQINQAGVCGMERIVLGGSFDPGMNEYEQV